MTHKNPRIFKTSSSSMVWYALALAMEMGMVWYALEMVCYGNGMICIGNGILWYGMNWH
jgi:hypothetical protein